MQTSSVTTFKPTDDWAMEEAFPKVDPGYRPVGTVVVIQLRSPKTKTRGGILLTDMDRDTEKWNTQIGKVVAIGPACFRDRTTGKPWPEGEWFKEGDYVRCPLFNGDKWAEPVPDGSGTEALFIALESEFMIRMVRTADPLSAKMVV